LGGFPRAAASRSTKAASDLADQLIQATARSLAGKFDGTRYWDKISKDP